nr:MAG TPA_asm: hypothetical protein [Caudoviricetes sp.]
MFRLQYSPYKKLYLYMLQNILIEVGRFHSRLWFFQES